MLTDQQWALIQPLLPPPASPNGRTPVDDRRVLDAIFYKLAARLPWYDLPFSFPSYQTVYRHYHQWKRLGILDSIVRLLIIDLRDRGGLDLPALHKERPFRPGLDDTLLLDPSIYGAWQVATALFLHAYILLKAKAILKDRSRKPPAFPPAPPAPADG